MIEYAIHEKYYITHINPVISNVNVKTNSKISIRAGKCNIKIKYIFNTIIILNMYNKEVFVKHEKTPTAPNRRGIEYIVYANDLKNHNFLVFLPASGGRNCQKANLHINTFRLSL